MKLYITEPANYSKKSPHASNFCEMFYLTAMISSNRNCFYDVASMKSSYLIEWLKKETQYWQIDYQDDWVKIGQKWSLKYFNKWSLPENLQSRFSKLFKLYSNPVSFIPLKNNATGFRVFLTSHNMDVFDWKKKTSNSNNKKKQVP